MLSLVFRRAAVPASGCVLCYHGLVGAWRDRRLERNFHLASAFRDHLRQIASGGVVSVAELLGLGGDSGGRRPGFAITFDDGYSNNLMAAELLAKARMPWTLFVSTAAVGAGKAIWTVELSLLLLHGNCRKLEALGSVWTLNSRPEREEAFQSIRYRMKAMTARERREALEGIRNQYPCEETERLLEEFSSMRMLGWSEIRSLAESGVEIGSHGVNHELHHGRQDPAVRRRELVESKVEIERQIGRPCRFFAFPNGDHCDASAGEVESAGYEAALTTVARAVPEAWSPFLLPRVSPGGSAAKLKAQLRQVDCNDRSGLRQGSGSSSS